MGQMDTYVGDDAMSKSSILRLTYPMEGGTVVRWDDLVEVWRHAFATLACTIPVARRVMLTDTPSRSTTQRVRMADVMFNTFGVDALCIVDPAVLALRASGVTTGLVLDIGEGSARAVPIHNGVVLAAAVTTAALAGADLVTRFVEVLNARPTGPVCADRATVRSLLEAVCYVAADPEEESKRPAAELTKAFTLPDGQTVSVGAERFEVTEALFRPALAGRTDPGLADAVATAIARCDPELCPLLYGHVVLSGGVTLCPGLPGRLRHELSARAPPTATVEVVDLADRRYMVWKGGSALVSSTTDTATTHGSVAWVTAQEYAAVAGESDASLTARRERLVERFV